MGWPGTRVDFIPVQSTSGLGGALNGMVRYPSILSRSNRPQV